MTFISRIERLESRYLLAMYTSDVSFGSAGVTDVRAGLDVDVQPDGKILVKGSESIFGGPEQGGDFDHEEFYQSRLNADGTLDTTFGEGGTDNITNDPPELVGSRYYTIDSFL